MNQIEEVQLTDPRMENVILPTSFVVIDVLCAAFDEKGVVIQFACPELSKPMTIIMGENDAATLVKCLQEILVRCTTYNHRHARN